MKQIHILVLSHLYPNNTNPINGIFVNKQLRELVGLQHKVTVISPVPYVPIAFRWVKKKWNIYSKIDKKEKKEGIESFYPRTVFLPLGILFELVPIWYFLSTIDVILKINRTQKIDIIHSHAALPDGVVGIWISRLLKIPFVVTTHGDDLQTRIYRNAFAVKLIKYVYKNSNAIVFVSTKLLKIFNKYFSDIPSKKVEIIYNGIDQNEIKSACRNGLKQKRLDQNILLSVGRLEKIKGHEWVIKALPEIIKNHNNIKYLIIGEGEEKDHLKNTAERLNVSRYIRFLGNLSHAITLQFISLCDIFILPSYNESFGIVYLEAMALAKPVIGCKDQGIQDCIQHGSNGFLVEPKNSEEIVDIVSRLLKHRAESAKIGQLAKKTVFHSYTWSENAIRHTSLYNRLIEE
jgi:teichuronic acid biosynthesis glycosyltransferase TuaC